MEEPLQLIQFKNAPSPSSPNNDCGDIQLNYTNLDRVLSRTENRPLCIICVSGPSRQGKSFLLGYMIRCLEAFERNEPDWMDWENKGKALSGFKFRNGTKPETQGIWLWSKPFLINVGDEETPIAVLLVDTQGTYDEFISSCTTSSIVGISLLMSSCMIFNFFKNLQEDVLTSLESYVTYGKLALENQGSSSTCKPFQKLTFLIRDWNNPAEFPFGAKGGKAFIEKKLQLKPDQSPEARTIRETIKSCFETLDCFLMPFPGDAAIMPDFQGSIQELNIPFAKKLEDFISNLINPDHLGETSVKRVLENVVTASEFKSYLETYISIFNSKEMPSPLTLLDATAQVANQSVLQKCLQKYLEVIRNHQRTKKYLKEEHMQKVDKLARKQSMSLFKSSKKFGTAEKLLELEDDLEGMMDKQLKEVKRLNQEKRDKIINSEVESALNTFKENIDLEFPFTSSASTDYYEETKIKKIAKRLIDNELDDFREKIGDDEEDYSSLDKLCTQVELKLKEYLEDHIILQNRCRQRAAEKAFVDLLDNLVKEYSEKLQKFLDENPYLDLSTDEGVAFQGPHDQLKRDLIKQFENEKSRFAPKGKKVPEFAGHGSSDFELHLSRAFASLTTEHTVRLQQHQLACESLVQELIEMHRKEMKAAALTDLEELEEWRNNRNSDYQAMFENRCCLPKNSSIFQTNLKSLLEKLEEVCKAVIYELEQKRKAAQQKLQNAIGDSYEMYHNEMTKRLKEAEFVEEDEFLRWNDDCVQNSIQNYKDCPIPTVNMENEGLETLSEKLIQDFEQLSAQRRQKTDLATLEAKNLVTRCHGLYQNEMKSCMERVISLEKLKEGHEKANEMSVKIFKDLCPVKLDSFAGFYIEQLEEENKEAFVEGLYVFELKMGEEETITAGAIADCRSQYDSEMGKHLKNQDFIRPDDLTKLHQLVAKKSVEVCNRRTPLTHGQRVALMEALEESFKKWKEENDMHMECEDVAIGIDLGTTYSCVAVYAGGKIRVIPDLQGKNTTPSYVAFQEDGSEVVGEPAKSRAYENPENTIYDAKRIIGRKFTDEKLQEDMKYWAFTVEEHSGIPKVNVRGRKLYPEEISATILKELKQSAEKFLKRPVTKAVITVPAYFTDGQRQATKDAGELAGLEVMMVLTEPVAAAMAYKKQHAETFGNPDDGNQTRNTVIFDVGGGTFDTAVLKSKQGQLETLAVDGDDHLGGEDFDRTLMQHCAEEFRRQHRIDLLSGKDSSQKQKRDEVRRRLKRLQVECERKKMELTGSRRVTVVVENIYGRTDLSVVVTRDKFEELNHVLFRKTLEGVERALKSAKMEKGDIQDIVLVGGSTRIPKVQEMLRSYFGGKALDSSINPDEAVAYGAAMKAAIMNGAITRENTDFTKIQDVTPMSIGVEIYGGGFSVIIPKSTKVPVKAHERYRTAHNNQTSVQVTIYQGEEKMAVRNKHLGDFYLNGIPPKGAEVENIDVEMVINAQGILHVNAVCSSTGVNTGIRVTENKQRMSRAVIQRLLAEHCED